MLDGVSVQTTFRDRRETSTSLSLFTLHEMKCEVRCMKDTAQILLVDDDVTLLQALPQALYLRIDGVGVDTCDSAPGSAQQDPGA